MWDFLLKLSLVRRFRYKRRRLRELSNLNLDRFNNLVFLVSYPKSGNSWLRVLLANCINENDNMDIGFHNLPFFIPDSHSKSQRELLMDSDIEWYRYKYKMIKSHDRYSSYYHEKKVVYIIRSYTNVIESYYHYINSRAEKYVTFKEIIEGKASAGYGTWDQHVSEWLETKDCDILFVSYEKLKTDTTKELKRITEFIGMSVSDDKLQKAVAKSTMQRMKELEHTYGYFNDNRTEAGKNTHFVRKGSILRSGAEIPPELMERVRASERLIADKLKNIKCSK